MLQMGLQGLTILVMGLGKAVRKMFDAGIYGNRALFDHGVNVGRVKLVGA